MSNTVIIAAGSTERMRVDDVGAVSIPTKLLLGGPTSALLTPGGAIGLQIYGNSSTFAPSTLMRGFSNTNLGANLLFVKTRGTTYTSFDAVQINDTLGAVTFLGSDGTANVSAGSVTAYVDGYNGATVSTGNVPTGLSFVTGITTGTQRMLITSAGNIGIGTSTPSISAALEVNSISQGVRFPNLTTAQKTGIATPAAGLMVFDTTLLKMCFYDGGSWRIITST
jgi:hypothetical protein